MYRINVEYGVVSEGLLTILGFVFNAEFSLWKRLPEFISPDELRLAVLKTPTN